MSRYRLLPTPAQEAVLRDHCAHARYVWNLAVEQHRHWRAGRAGAPGYLEQCRQLTQARAEHPWLGAGSQTVQQQALRDFAQAVTSFFDPASPAGRPSWRKAGRHEGFRIVGRGGQWDVLRVSRKVGQVRVPKVGWVRFRWSRAVPPNVKSYRVTMDRAGRWHVAFAAVPEPVPAPGNGQAVGIDRGVAVAAALSTGELLHCPGLTVREQARLRRMQRTLARAKRGSNRRGRVKHAIARLRARETDRRRDWAEKASTGIARRFDLIRVEDLKITNMTRSAKGTRENPGRNVRAKAGLNRGILRSGWGLLVRRLQDKAPGRVRLTTYACDMDTFAADAAVAQLQRAARGVVYLDGGWAQLVAGLAARCQVRTGIKVTGVGSAAGRVEVATGDGPLAARSVIIAAGRPAAALRLLPADPGWGDLGPELTAACLDAGLRRVPDPGYVLGIDAPVYAAVQSPPARGQAPAGQAVVAAVGFGATGARADRTILEAHLARAGLREEDVVTSRFLARMVVAGAAPVAARGGLSGRPAAGATGLPGVYLAGDWVGPAGLLADAALASGHAAALRAVQAFPVTTPT